MNPEHIVTRFRQKVVAHKNPITGDATVPLTDQAIIILPKLGWRWRTDTALFEPIHGMSRVTKLLPDKLVTTEHILLDHRRDKGKHRLSFIIELVIDLVERYCELATTHKIKRGDLSPMGSSFIYVSGFKVDQPELEDNSALDFDDVCSRFKEQLQNFAKDVEEKGEPDVHSSVPTTDRQCLGSLKGRIHKILKMADGIAAAAATYLEYVHPLLVKNRRSIGSLPSREDHEEAYRHFLNIERRNRIAIHAVGRLQRQYDDIVWDMDC
jgi:hypothetical protein